MADHIIGDDMAGLRGPIETSDDKDIHIAELEHKLADALQSVQSWQMEVAGRDADIARLERELDEARAHAKWAEEDGKKWKKRAECIARWYCTKASCIECRHKSKCRFHTHPPALLFATADKE